MDNQNDKGMAIIAYILFFIPLIAVKNRSLFLNFHINQGLSLFIVAIIGSFVLNFIPIPYLFMIWNLAIIILAVVGILNAFKGRTVPLPVIGNLFKIF